MKSLLTAAPASIRKIAAALADQEADQGALAGAVGPQQADDLPGMNP